MTPTKIPTEDQHKIQHEKYPGNCCLCKAEAHIRELELELYETKNKLSVNASFLKQPKVKTQLECEVEKWKEIVRDMCDDEEEARKHARKVLSEWEVYGDSYGVPTIDFVVEQLVNKYRKDIVEADD